MRLPMGILEEIEKWFKWLNDAFVGEKYHMVTSQMLKDIL